MTAAETLTTKLETLAAQRAALAAQLDALDATIANLQGLAHQFAASSDQALIESLWAEAQK